MVVEELGGTGQNSALIRAVRPLRTRSSELPTTENSSIRCGADPVALVAGRRPHEVEQSGEGVLDVAAEDVEVGDDDRGLDVGGVGRGGGPGRGEVDALGALHEAHLGQPELGVVVLGVLGERPLVGVGRTDEVSALDRVEGLLVQGRQGLGVVGTLDGLRARPAR